MFAGFYGGAPVDMSQWGYCYWSSGSDGMKIVGFRGDYGLGDKNIFENPKELLMGTPATYNDTFPNSARWVVEIAENPADYDSAYISTVQKILTVDAFGTMITPYDTFEVIRVHEYFIGIDTIAAIFYGDTLWSMQIANDTLNNYYFWANGLGYPVAIAHCNKNNTLLKVEYVTYKAEAFPITGMVYQPGGQNIVDNGTVQLIAKDEWAHLYGVEETVNIVDGGHFQFSYVTWGNWLILADPDNGTYPNYFPTYYGDAVAWENAATLAVQSDTNITITVVEDLSDTVQTGNGLLSGIIWQDTITIDTKEPADAIKAGNVKVTLEENPGGAALLFSVSDTSGQYEFTNLANGSYKLKVEIAGLYMDSTYIVEVSQNQLIFNNLDFLYDSTQVHPSFMIAVEELHLDNLIPVKIYPNPFTDNATVSIENIDKPFNYDFILLNNTGKIIRYWKGTSTGSFQISGKGLVSGNYLFELKVKGRTIYKGKILVEKY
ncbi:MAG: T9SS type A sorting domain-containing protein, partial [Bacteroidia bacterium]|nr:T9SS type A sorting domain-containing protein [Bacteroidia bacterium]